jgi:Zn-dependent protease with chaperone function
MKIALVLLLALTESTVFARPFANEQPVASPGRSPAKEPTAAKTPASVDERTLVRVPEPTSKAIQFHRGNNWLWVLNQVSSAAFLTVFLVTGASAKLRNLAARMGRVWFFTICLYLLLFTLIGFVADFPLSYYQGFVRRHAYGLSNQSFAKWLRNLTIEFGISVATGVAVAWFLYLVIARAPKRWWLYATGASIPFLMAAMLITPLWIDPLFNRFGRLSNPSLESQILTLADRAGIPADRVYEVDKSVDTNAVNAYVTGFLGSKRIVLWDTLVNRLDDQEVLAVMGHEMGHYVLGHVPRTIMLSSVITLIGLFWVDRAGRWITERYHRRFGFDRLSDIASLPLILLLVQVASLALAPVGHAYGRYQEHEADRFGLELTHANYSTGRAFVALSQENLGNPRPGWFYRVWRATHPSTSERIEFSNTYHPWREGRPLRYGVYFAP